jgi:hypothetical protein
LRTEIQDFIARNAPAGLAAADRIHVVGPEYAPVDVQAIMVPLPSADAGVVEENAKAALREFLHPLTGGRDKRGWPPGRPVFQSDVASVLRRVDGIDYVEELHLIRNGVLQGDAVVLPDNGVVLAGELRLKLKDPVL